MKRQTSAKLVSLGTASKRTLGADGPITDFVRMIDHWGISRD